MLRTMLFSAIMAAVALPSVIASAGSPRMAPHHHHQHAIHHTLNHAFVRGLPVLREPGYLYVPRVGIIDEACNLPTSACPNDMRDVQ